MPNYLTTRQACEYLGLRDNESVYRFIRRRPVSQDD